MMASIIRDKAMQRLMFVIVIIVAVIFPGHAAIAQSVDPLPSWTDDNASLDAATANGWIIVRMKDDWSTIYPSGGEQ